MRLIAQKYPNKIMVGSSWPLSLTGARKKGEEEIIDPKSVAALTLELAIYQVRLICVFVLKTLTIKGQKKPP